MSDDAFSKKIVTFMRRASPLNTSQRQALEQYIHLLIDGPVIPYAHPFLQTDKPLTLEIGFGLGRSLVLMSKAMPERNFIGIEVHKPGIAQCLFEAGKAELTNLNIIEGDAIEVLSALPDASLDGVQLFFPDPWQKKRHYKRRFVSHDRMPLIEAKLKQGGTFHAATDWENYAQWMVDVLNNRPALEHVQGKFEEAPRPQWRPETKFERRGIASGHKIWDFIYRKK